MSPIAAHDEAPLHERPRRVLVVDDDRDFAEALQEYLAAYDYVIETADNPRQALEIDGLFQPEIVLIDLRLGHTSGIDLIGAFKRRRADVICVMITAFADVDTAVEAMRSEADDYLGKPLEPTELLATLERGLAKLKLIREKHAAERALAESRELLEAVINAAPLGINAKDIDSRYVFMNRYQAANYGVAPEQAEGKTPHELVNWRYGAYIRTLDRQVIEGGEPLKNFEEEVTDAAGVRRTWLSTKVPLKDDQDATRHVVTVSLDITERKRAEEALRLSEERLRSMAAAGSDWLWEQDEALRFSYLSGRHAEVTGLDPERLLGRRSEEMYAELALRESVAEEAWQQHFATIQAHLDYRDFTYSVRRPDGARRVVRTSGKAIFDGQGVFKGYRGTGADITGEVEAREKAEAAEANLRQAQTMDALGQLTGGVAHDFNNLLNVILGSLDILDEQLQDDHELLELVQAAIHSAVHGAELTHRLLAYSRRQPLQPALTDLNQHVSAMSSLLGRTLNETIDIKTVLGEPLSKVKIDQHELETALINLAVNARDAMPEGGTMTIETANVHLDENAVEEDLQPGDYVKLAVADNGVGMPPDVLEQAVEPFFTTKEVGRGSGLGLSMVYGFVKQSGGHVEFTSSVGTGTTVTLYFPISREIGAPAPRQISSETARMGSGETVLVVEDSPDVRGLALDMLSSLGYRTLAVGDGESALVVLGERTDVDLLFTDVVLPHGMNGVQLARRARERQPGLKVLYASGYSETVIGQDNVLADGAMLVRKPYRKAALANHLRQMLDDFGE